MVQFCIAMKAKWWANWFVSDYSWNNLKHHKIHEDNHLGGCSGGAFGEKSLQDYWRWTAKPEISKYKNEPIDTNSAPIAGRYRSDKEMIDDGELVQGADDEWWHIVHLPLFWKNECNTSSDLEISSWKRDSSHERWDFVSSLILERLRRAENTADIHWNNENGKAQYRFFVKGNDTRAQLNGTVLQSLRRERSDDLQLEVFVASCENAVFLNTFLGQSLTFGNGTSFGNTLFLKGAWFNKSTFFGNVGFKDCQFCEDTGFNSATFEGGARFLGTRFCGSAYFVNSIFKFTTDFSNAIMADLVRFPGAELHPDTTFDGASFTEINNKLRNASSTFLRLVLLALLPILIAFALNHFYKSEYENILYFLSGLIALVATRWSIVRGFVKPANDGEKLRMYADDYRLLRQISRDNNNNRDENKFHSLELKSIRLRTNTNFFERCVSCFYDWFSEYGNAILRPLLALFMTIFVSTLFYWSYAQRTGIENPDSIVHVYHSWDFAVLNAFKPLSALTINKAENNELLIHLLLSTDGTGVFRASIVKTVSTLQSLTSVSFLFLIALGLRKRFQMS